MKTNKEQLCNIHVMPASITDADISSLFNGILNVVKKKFELDSKKEIILISNEVEHLRRELKSKTSECVRLKNEIIALKEELKQQNSKTNF